MNDDKKNEEKKGINPVQAAVTGAVVGAGVVAAGVVALQNKDNQKRVKDAFENVKGRAKDYMEDMQKAAQDKKDDLVADGKREVKKATKAVKPKTKSAKK